MVNMRRREFISLFGSAAAPVACAGRERHSGALQNLMLVYSAAPKSSPECEVAYTSLPVALLKAHTHEGEIR
jgi:hypothetical protein